MGSDRLPLLVPPRTRVLLLVTSGVLGALAFPSTDWWLFAWVWLAPTLWLATWRTPRGALADGWLAGTVFFLVLLRWLDHTFRHFSLIPWPLTWLPIAALAAYCGLYLGATAAAVAWLRRRIGAGPALATAPALWVAGEWLRGWLMGGFPWGLLGYSQHSVLPVIQIAEITGVYGVSFVLVATSAALAGLAALGPRRGAAGALGAAALVAGTVSFGGIALDTPPRTGEAEAPRIRVSVIQPSIDQSIKWDPAQHAEILAVYEELTREAGRSRPTVILWPETATTIFLRRDPALLDRLTTLSREIDTPILVGSIDLREGSRRQLLNSAFLLTGRGIVGKYDKIQLVPFGEYVPLSGLIGFVRSWAEFISDFGAGEQATVLSVPGGSFGTIICYEVIFPGLFREFVVGGAAFMANITNDAWFGRTSGPWQHLATLPLRAVEHRVSIARAANTGVSAFVDPAGRVTGALGLFERGVLERSVALRTRATFYTRYGDWLVYACLAGAALAFAGALYRRA
ncbi:MAG: apolipoprotein N-acyltransferase [Candidatus Rokubacteria bacterium]|nr:apolipoprotein N-acyltransferase [Candidatus Rokubacteria bacterium]